jgi:glycosyltransferase involved in cell wall biosynthesis
MDAMTDAPMASVVVPCKGHAEQLERCLESLARQSASFAYETIVVDSAADPDVEAVARRFAGIRIVSSGDDLLAGPARNLGAGQARGEYLAFIDADCQAEPGWLAAAVEELSLGAKMVGGPVLDALPWHPVAVTDNLTQFSDFRPGRKDGPARYFPACNMAMSGEAFGSVGGFPDVGVNAGEDTALCDRVLERWPRDIRFVQRMRVRHDGRTGLAEFLRHQSAFGYARGILGLHMTATHRRWGARSVALPAVVLKRLSYVAGRAVRWDPARAPRTVLLLPLLVAGLCAWAGGFRRGCREAMEQLEGSHGASVPGSVRT